MKAQFFPYKDENVAQRFPYITIFLIILNVAIFIGSLADFENIIYAFGFVPAAFTVVTVFTSMFLHGGFDHLFGNMWYMFIFGDNVEDKMGRLKYIVFYLASGIAATFTHYITNLGSDIPAIGASGAISGVLGAYLAMFPRVKVHVASYYYHGKVPASAIIGFWFILQLIFGSISFIGATGSGVAFWAHIGGFVFGYGVTKLMRMK